MANPNIGRFTWHELMMKDAKASVRFYQELFGWKVSEMPMGGHGTYYMFAQGESPVCGGMVLEQKGIPSHWLTYVGVEDADATAAKIKSNGGQILVPPTEVPNMVRFIVATDPQGAAFGAVKDLSPRAGMPAQEGPPAPGTFCWDELHTKDQDAAAKFYSTVFGWTGKTGKDDPMKYWHWMNQSKDIGGMMTLQMPNVPPHWLGYIATANVDASTAKAKELGGKELVPAMEVEKVGRFSVIADPEGAAFALFRSAHV
jgi:predicted enzyme related to lactoylglutathione lyase